MTLPLARGMNYIAGQLTFYSDLNDLQAWARMKDSILAYGVGGTAAFLPASGGLAVTPGSGLQVLVGPAGAASQLIFLPSYAADGTWKSVGTMSGQISQAAYVTSQSTVNLAAAPGSGLSRIDIICVRFKQTNANPHTVNVRSGSTVTPTTVNNFDDTIDAVTLVTGVPATLPLVPSVPDSTWTLLAQVLVYHGDTQVVNGDISIEIPTFAQIVAQYVSGSGLLQNLAAGPGISLGLVSGLVKISNTGVLSLSGLTGAVGFESSTGIVFGTDTSGSNNNVTIDVSQKMRKSMGFVSCRLRVGSSPNSLYTNQTDTTSGAFVLPATNLNVTIPTSSDDTGWNGGSGMVGQLVGVVSVSGATQFIGSVQSITSAHMVVKVLLIQLGSHGQNIVAGATIQAACQLEYASYFQRGTLLSPGVQSMQTFFTELGCFHFGGDGAAGVIVQEEFQIQAATSGVVLQFYFDGGRRGQRNVFLDGVLVASVANIDNGGPCSFTLPDTALHSLVLQVDGWTTDGSNATFAAYVSPWMPSGPTGGVDPTQIQTINAGLGNYAPATIPGS